MTRISREKYALGLFVAAATLSISVAPAKAALLTWDGGVSGVGNAWTSGSNWLGDVVPTATDSIAFNLATTQTISLGGAQTVVGLNFGGASSAFTIGDATDIANGYALTLTNVTRSGSPTVNQTIAANVILAANSTWDIGAGTGTFKVSGGISGTGKSLTKIGGGTLTLTGTNTYTGATVVNGGNLTLDFVNMVTPTNIVSTSSTLVLGGGTLQVRQKSGVVTSQTFANTVVNPGASSIIATNVGSASALNITLGNITRTTSSGTTAIGSGGGGGILNFTLPTTGSIATSSTNDVTGILGTWASVGSGTALKYAAVTSGTIGAYTGATVATAADLSNVTSGTTNYSFAAAATQTGAITANTLQYLGTAGTLANAGNSITLNGLMNAGTGLLTVSGTGKVIIGANRELVIQSNTQSITISSVIANNAAGKSGLTYRGGGTLLLTGTNTYTGDTTVLAGTVATNSSGTIYILGDLIVGSSSGGPAAVFGSAVNNTYFNLSNTSNATVYSNGLLYFVNSPGGHLKTLTVVGGTATSNYGYVDGMITMTGGLINGSGGLYGANSAVTTLASSSTATLAANLTGNNAYTFTVADGDAAIDLNFTGTKGQGSITKTGAGVMAVGGANAFNGATTVSAGTLLLTNSNALQNSPLANGGTGIVFDSSVASHAFKVGGLNGSGNLALQDNASTPNAVALTISNTTATVRSYSGILSGGGSVIKSGTGTQTFTGANTYSGSTAVSAGTLALSGSGSFGTSTVSVSGGTLDLGGKSITNTLGAITGGAVNNGTITNDGGNYDLQGGTVGANLAGSNGLNKTSADTVTLLGVNTYTGVTTVTTGTLALGATGSINNSSKITVRSGATLDISGLNGASIGAAQTLEGAGNIAGPASGALVVSGTLAPGEGNIGTLAVSGSLTLAGTTVIDINKTGLLLTSDLVTGATTLTLGGNLVVNLTGDDLLAGDAFTIFSAGQYVGAFANDSLILPSLGSGLAWDTTQLSVDGQLLVVGVPEPATWTMIVGGLGMLAFGTRLRRRIS